MLKEIIKELYVSNSVKKSLKVDNQNKYYLDKNYCTDKNISDLVSKGKAVGVFAPKSKNGKTVSKFITFDFDFEKLKYAQKAVTKVIEILEKEFGIEEEYILVNYSGNKGYHLSLFFTEYIDIRVLRQFYSLVLFFSGYNTREIEFRPTNVQGVKLPLSKHPLTKEKSAFVNPYTFEKISDYAMMNVKKLERDEFSEMIRVEVYPKYKNDPYFTTKKKINFTGDLANILDKVSLQNEDGFELSNRFKAEYILETGLIPSKSSRHSATLLLAIYFNTIKKDKEEAVEAIEQVIQNSYTHGLIKASTNEIYACTEVQRLVNYVYENNLNLNKKIENITIYKEELDTLLTIKDISLRKTALVLLMHSKGYNELNVADGEFFCSYRQLQDYGIKTNAEHIRSYYQELEKLGLISITNKSKLRKRDEFSGMYHTTKFKVHFRKNSGTDKVVINSNDYDFEQLEFEHFAGLFYQPEEIKNIYTKTSYYRKYKQALIDAKEIKGLMQNDVVESVDLDNNVHEIISNISSVCIKEILSTKNKKRYEKPLAKNFTILSLDFLYPFLDKIPINTS